MPRYNFPDMRTSRGRAGLTARLARETAETELDRMVRAQAMVRAHNAQLARLPLDERIGR